MFIKVFFKELKIISFDSVLAKTLGFSPIILHYGLMTLVSVTTVTSFDAVGSILVIALMIGPTATALIFINELKLTLLFSIIIGIINSILGYAFALIFDTNISGMIATTTLIVFLTVLIFEPKKGIISSLIRRSTLKRQYDFWILIFHLHSHQGELSETSYQGIRKELKWNNKKLRDQIHKGEKLTYLQNDGDCIKLTTLGLDFHNKKSRNFRIKRGVMHNIECLDFLIKNKLVRINYIFDFVNLDIPKNEIIHMHVFSFCH